MAKKIKLEGYGNIVITPLKFVDKDFENVDLNGNPLNYIKGTVKRGHYEADGVEIPAGQVCKKIEIEGEEIIQPKLKPIKEISKEDIEVEDDNSLIYNALERKIYAVLTEHEKIKKLLDERKSLVFPLVVGNGWKIYKGVLTKFQDKYVLFGCRGNFAELLNQFSDDTVEFEVPMMETTKNTKKLLKALG